MTTTQSEVMNEIQQIAGNWREQWGSAAVELGAGIERPLAFDRDDLEKLVN
jgi:hypothetical protein